MKSPLCLVLALAGFSAVAADWYADAVNGNDLWDGTSSSFVSGTTGPKKTLQAALDIETLKSDDTLWLLPGDYNEGSNVWDGVSRGCVKTAGLRVKSTGGAAVTFITGENDPAADYGYSATRGMRCLAVDSAASGVVIEGVFLRNGCAPYGGSDGAHGYGGGFYNPSGDAWLIASSITNCSAYKGGAAYGGNLYRVRSLDCTGNNRGGHLYTCGWIYNCLVSGTSKTAIGGGNAKLVNTTVIGCRTTSTYAFNDEGNSVANSIVLDNGASGAGNGCNYAVSMKTSVFGAGAPTATDAEEAKTCVTDKTYLDVAMVGGFARDARLLSTSPVAAMGDAACAAAVPIPSGYAHLDLAGDPMPASGPIAAGCYQTPAVQTASRVVFSQPVVVKGYDRPFAAGEWFYPTKALHPETDACVLAMKPVNEKAYALYSNDILMPNGRAFRHYVEADGWADFVPVADPAATTTVIVESTGNAKHLYVDQVNGNDLWDGLSPVHVPDTLTGPVRSPMVAVTNAVDCSTIFFAPGVYDYGFVTRTDAQSNVARFRIDTNGKQLALVGTEGAERTILVGARDTTADHGCGANAIGGIYASGTYVLIKGFTLTDCASTAAVDSDSTPALQRGAAVNGVYSYTQVMDCIITNNIARMASAVNNSQIFRCVIGDNDSYLDVVRDSNCYGCTFFGNRMRVANGTNNNSSMCDGIGTLNFCSVDFRNAREPGGRYKSVSAGSSAHDCVYTGYLGSETLDNVLYGVDPLFADPLNGDFRLGVLSPARGRKAWNELSPVARVALAKDLRGQLVALDGEGRIPLGAVNNAPFLPCVTVDVAGGDIAFAGGSLVRGTNVITGASATLSIATPTARPFAGFEVDGVLRETTSLELTDFAAGETKAVRVVSGLDWYVDAVNGNDANGGGSRALAKKTIRCATTNAVAHDVIHVLPGTYGAAEGAQDCGGGRKVKTRVLLPANVTLVSTDGPEQTVIEGAADPNPEDSSGFGLGPDAIRCVWAKTGAKISGFTLTGGRTSYTTKTDNVDLMAAGVYSESSGGALVDHCILSNNFAKTGTAAMYADLRCCRIVCNKATDYGPAAHTCALTGCYIDGNEGNDTTMGATRIESCTFGPENRNAGGASYATYAVGRGSTDFFPILNSVFCRGNLGDGQWFVCATNCVFNSDYFNSSRSRLFESNCCNCVVTNLDAIGVAADGRLVAGSPAIDLGDAAIAGASVDLEGTDAYGTQRIYNGRLDAGAAEFDWRPVYARILGRRVDVDLASSGVTLDGRTLVLPSGELAGIVPAAGTYRTSVSVSGTGTLRLFADGVLAGSFTSADGTKTATLKDLAAGASFRYAYEPGEDDDGAALVSRLTLDRGLIMIFR